MKKIFVFCAIVIVCISSAQSKSEIKTDITAFQKELNELYLNPKDTPLRGENFANFKQHPFFHINLKYRVVAKFEKTPDAIPFEIPTSSGRTKPYVQYGKASFKINGKIQTVAIYQSISLRDQDEYKDHLFLPFRDATNSIETYGGGRYIDLKIPNGNTIVIDFNKAYQPYCAYNAFDYSCPIVPKENFLEIPIKAGVKYDDVYHH